MIIEELLEIIRDKKNAQDGTLLNSLYDEFRDGRDRNDILILLNSDDEMIGFGCDICCEIFIRDNDIQKKIMDRLYFILMNNKDSYNRERASNALYGFYMDNKDVIGLKKLYSELLEDEIEDIRTFAKEFIENN